MDCCKVPFPTWDISFFFCKSKIYAWVGVDPVDSGPKWRSTGCTLLTGFLWLLVTDFFVHWQSGFLCSAGSASPFCPVLLLYQPRVGTATPASAALAQLPCLPCQATAPCVPPFCEIGAFRAAPENLGPWCVGTGRDGPAGYRSEVSSCPGFRPQRRVMLLLALPPSPTSVQAEQ